MSLADKADKAASALSELETATLNATAEQLRTHIAALQRMASAGWIDAFGDLSNLADDPYKLAALVRALRAHIADAPTEVARTLRKATKEAVRLGTAHAADAIPGKVKVPRIRLTEDITRAVVNAPAKAEDRLRVADHLLDRVSGLAGYDELLPAVSTASQAVTAMSNAATYALNAASNLAISKVAASNDVGLVYVAERDACLDCNPQSGLTSAEGFDDPPLHPNCRCQVQPYSPEWADPDSIGYPDGLRREAERSVARGLSSSDSNAARVRAADALLTRGTNLPASVQKVAARAVRKGAFSN